MLRALIKKEIRDLTGSTKFVYTFAVTALLIVFAFYSGAVSYKQDVERWDAARAENLRRLDGVTDWLRVEDNRLFLPPQPLASLVNGISNDIGRTTTVAPRGEVSAEDSRYNEEPVFAVFRFLDLGFIFQVVLSLFAILLGYDAISGEKERGTLRLCMANAISRPTFLLGKFIGSYLSLAVSLLIPMLLGCLMLPLLGVHLSNDEWLRLAVIIISGMLFFGAFLSLSLLVSTSTRSTANSFLLLLVLWVGGVLILPQVSVLLAGRAVDVPTVDRVGYRKAAYASELWKEFRDGMGSFTAPNTTDPEEMLAAFNGFIDSLTSIRDEKMNEFRSRVNEERNNRVEERASVAFGLARVSPSVALSLATAEMAGTSPALKSRYYDQAMEYQQVLGDFLFEKTGIKVGGRMIIMKVEEGGEEPQPIDAAELPVFSFRRPPFNSSLISALPDLGLLAFFNLAFFAGAMVAFNRYDVR